MRNHNAGKLTKHKESVLFSQTVKSLYLPCTGSEQPCAQILESSNMYLREFERKKRNFVPSESKAKIKHQTKSNLHYVSVKM